MTLDYLSVNVRKPYKFSALFPVCWTDIFYVQIWQYIAAVVNNAAHTFTVRINIFVKEIVEIS